ATWALEILRSGPDNPVGASIYIHGGSLMQNQPPGPPPGTPPPGNPPSGYEQGTPPPSYQPGYQPATTAGIDKRTGAFLSYLLGWITGIIFLFVGKNDPDVKYHAAQSLVFFGGLTVLNIIISIVSNINGLAVVGYVGSLISLIQFIGWIYCLYKAWTGNGARFEIPVLGGV